MSRPLFNLPPQQPNLKSSLLEIWRKIEINKTLTFKTLVVVFALWANARKLTSAVCWTRRTRRQRQEAEVKTRQDKKTKTRGRGRQRQEGQEDKDKRQRSSTDASMLQLQFSAARKFDAYMLKGAEGGGGQLSFFLPLQQSAQRKMLMCI